MADLRSVIDMLNDLVSRIDALSDVSEIGVFPRINAAAFIKFFMIWVRRLFEGGVYSRAAFI